MTRHRGNTTVAFSEFRRCHGPGPEEILSSRGSGHDSPLNNASGVMVTCSLDTESVYQISRNDAGATQAKVATSISANNTSSHTVEINVNTTDVTVILDNVTYGPYTVDIPSLTVKMSFFMHIEAIGSTAKSLQIFRMQTTCL